MQQKHGQGLLKRMGFFFSIHFVFMGVISLASLELRCEAQEESGFEFAVSSVALGNVGSTLTSSCSQTASCCRVDPAGGRS